jgi:hypothetical protein
METIIRLLLAGTGYGMAEKGFESYHLQLQLEINRNFELYKHGVIIIIII